MARSTQLMILIKKYIFFMGSETLPSACYILSDASSIPFTLRVTDINIYREKHVDRGRNLVFQKRNQMSKKKLPRTFPRMQSLLFLSDTILLSFLSKCNYLQFITCF